MEVFFAIYAALAALGVAVLAGAMLWNRFSVRRRRGWATTLRDKYLRSVIYVLMSDQGEVPHFPMIHRAGARRLLAEVIAGLVAATYGLDQAPLRRMVREYHLDEYLLRRVRFSQGYRRARDLALLAHLPAEADVVSQVARYISSRNRYVRFCGLMAQLSGDPATSLRLMAEYPHPFSAYEVSEIMTMLRRGMLPIAYEPLVLSGNRNLQAVGLGIVRQFGIEEAEIHLRRMVGGEVPGVGRDALYTLCALRRPIAGAEVVRCIAAMNRPERKALMRFMALEGYSAQMLRRLFDEQERSYYESLVHSYKRCLA